MEPIRVRNPHGEEFTFTDPDQFGRAIADGTITPQWAVYEASSGRWTRVGGGDADVLTQASGPDARRSGEVVLIYPPDRRTPAGENSADPLDLVSILTPEEIDRVLGRRSRASTPETPVQRSDDHDRRSA